jgi:hypothetical protein
LYFVDVNVNYESDRAEIPAPKVCGGASVAMRKCRGKKKARSKTGLEGIQETGVSRGSKETTGDLKNRSMRVF